MFQRWIVSKKNQYYGTERGAAGVAAFCDFQKMIKQRNNYEWDIAMYIVDK